MNAKRKLRKELERMPAECPVCGMTSDSIKYYSFPGRVEPAYMACPKCMRERIINQAGIGVIRSLVIAWPIVYLPWMAVNLTRTYVRGHSEHVIDLLQQNTSNEWK